MAPDAPEAPALQLDPKAIAAEALALVRAGLEASPQTRAVTIAPDAPKASSAQPQPDGPTDEDASRYSVAEAMATGNQRLVMKVRDYWSRRGVAVR